MSTFKLILFSLIAVFVLSSLSIAPEKRRRPTAKTDPTLSMQSKQKKKLAKMKRKKVSNRR